MSKCVINYIDFLKLNDVKVILLMLFFDTPEFHHGGQSKPNTEDTEEWDKEFHPPLNLSAIASSYGPKSITRESKTPSKYYKP